MEGGITGRKGVTVTGAGAFTAADIMLGHSIFMANRLGQVSDEMGHVKEYIGRIEARPAFQKAITL